LIDDHPFFLHYAEGLAATLRNMVFSDQVVYPATTKGEVLELLEEHITDNIVKVKQAIRPSFSNLCRSDKVISDRLSVYLKARSFPHFYAAFSTEIWRRDSGPSETTLKACVLPSPCSS